MDHVQGQTAGAIVAIGLPENLRSDCAYRPLSLETPTKQILEAIAAHRPSAIVVAFDASNQDSGMMEALALTFKQVPIVAVVDNRAGGSLALGRGAQDYCLLAEVSEQLDDMVARSVLRNASTLRARASEVRLREAFDAMSSGMLVTDADGCIVDLNIAAASLLGLLTACVSQRLVDVAPGAMDLLRGTVAAERQEATIQTADGRRRTIGFSARQSPSNTYRVTIFQDLSHVVEIEERRRRAEQLAEVGELASRLSHEIKNPLASILAGLDLLRTEPGIDAASVEIVERVLDEVRGLIGTMRELLGAARLSAFAPTPVVFAQVVGEAIEPYRSLASRHGVTLTLHCDGPPETAAVVDLTWFRRVVSNLVVNAVEAAGAGGHVQVTGRVLHPNEAAERFPGYAGNVLALSVSDDGPGIATELLESIFEPFFTTKKDGTGLGLSTAKDIVEAHGGQLRVVASKSGGGHFEVLLPAYVGPPCWQSSECGSECAHCAVREQATGYCCWVTRGKGIFAQSGRWMASCYSCPAFRRGNLAPFAQ